MKSSHRNRMDRLEKAMDSVNAYAIMFDGKFAGRMAVAYPCDGAGLLRVMVSFTAGPLAPLPRLYGDASGYGYDKRTAAFRDALSAKRITEAFKDYLGVIGKMPEGFEEASTAAHNALHAVQDGYGWEKILEHLGYSAEWIV